MSQNTGRNKRSIWRCSAWRIRQPSREICHFASSDTMGRPIDSSCRSRRIAEKKEGEEEKTGAKPVPVITLVLHFGTKKRWDQPLSIKELLDIPDYLDAYVSDYRIHVFDIAWLTEEQLAQFESDFGIVANFFVQNERTKTTYRRTPA